LYDLLWYLTLKNHFLALIVVCNTHTKHRNTGLPDLLFAKGPNLV